MSELFKNKDFETESYWVRTAEARYSTDKPRTGLQSMEISKLFGPFPPSDDGNFGGVIEYEPGFDHVITCFYNPYRQNDDATPQFKLRCQYLDEFGAQRPIGVEENVIDTGVDIWHQVSWTFNSTTAILLPVGTSLVVQFEYHHPGDPLVLAVSRLYIDNVSMSGPPDQTELLVRSNALLFMEKVKAMMENVDPNIGAIFTSEKRWLGTRQYKDDAGINITVAGLFDDATMIGREVSRFWVMSPFLTSEALTNSSDEYRCEVTITGFFSRLENNSQEVALQKAVVEWMGKLSEKTVELTTLNTGAQYIGYLQERPEMILPIQTAVLDEGGVSGHTVQFKVTFFEEVPRA